MYLALATHNHLSAAYSSHLLSYFPLCLYPSPADQALSRDPSQHPLYKLIHYGIPILFAVAVYLIFPSPLFTLAYSETSSHPSEPSNSCFGFFFSSLTSFSLPTASSFSKLLSTCTPIASLIAGSPLILLGIFYRSISHLLSIVSS